MIFVMRRAPESVGRSISTLRLSGSNYLIKKYPFGYTSLLRSMLMILQVSIDLRSFAEALLGQIPQIKHG
ncbi:MAG: hypothetical protein B6D70_07565 [gamma proteobacterium symbiont of Stewartia floridana]|nr:MAG: hypothetical protein B6D76_10765 [gamma proteobacterium symbiont of Stewartia floridana]RLW60554.1 MAG: hypothetical protein B6D75_05795 [gamma proteobacterium symbiont of Stewartia floridana]RLW62277.1 MAG: hypothetical protein B6D70_07565 [gamma proteobacterium symbiont of Stewartia floridana]RLW62949.1 MAG: hypothetical protein B6D73_17555 [gamma proteobacterium symbiont of Stewartia floridana]